MAITNEQKGLMHYCLSEDKEFSRMTSLEDIPYSQIADELPILAMYLDYKNRADNLLPLAMEELERGYN